MDRIPRKIKKDFKKCTAKTLKFKEYMTEKELRLENFKIPKCNAENIIKYYRLMRNNLQKNG